MTAPARSVHFLHIGKTGGTAVVHALREGGYAAMPPGQVRQGLSDIYGIGASPGRDGLTIYVHPHYDGLREVPEGEPVFFFLRDPIRRCISGFCSRQLQGWPRYKSPWTAGEERAFARFATIDALATALSSPDAERRAHAEEAMGAIQHLQSSYWDWFEREEYLRSRWSDVLFVGGQESLTHDFARLQVALGLAPSLRLPTDPVQAFRGSETADRSLSVVGEANLRQWCRRDYALIDLCAVLQSAGAEPAAETNGAC